MPPKSIEKLRADRRACIDKALASAISPADAETKGLVPITKGLSTRRWDTAVIFLGMIDSFKNAPERQATLVKTSHELVEIWALPFKTTKISQLNK